MIRFYVNLILFYSLDLRHWIVWWKLLKEFFCHLQSFYVKSNLAIFEIAKMVILTIFKFWFWFWSIFALINCWNWHARTKIIAYKPVKITFWVTLKLTKLISRQIQVAEKLSNCVPNDYLAIVGNTDRINEA